MPAPGALTPRTRVLLVLLMGVLIVASVHRLRCAEAPGPYTVFSGATMGTTYDVKVAGDGIDGDGMRTLGALVQARLDRIDALMSTWNPASEVSRFNAARTTDPFPISAETAQVLAIANEVYAASGGAFDITVGPLVDAYGFGPGDRTGTPPDEATRARLEALVGQDKLTLDVAAGTLAKQHPEIAIDLSAVAKGFGVDAVALALEEVGRHDYLVEVGGELRAAGVRRDGRGWRVAIERPSDTLRVIHDVIPLDDRSLATSGDYRNFYERDGVRISHTIDPRTGTPIRHDLASVSVVMRDAGHADAWATALNVLGAEAGYTLAERLGLAAFFLQRLQDGGFRETSTTAFEAIHAADAEAREATPAP